MSYRFLLDGIDVAGDDFSIDEQLQLSSSVLAYAAESDLTLWNVAVPSTSCALDPSTLQGIVQNCFLDQSSIAQPNSAASSNTTQYWSGVLEIPFFTPVLTGSKGALEGANPLFSCSSSSRAASIVAVILHRTYTPSASNVMRGALN